MRQLWTSWTLRGRFWLHHGASETSAREFETALDELDPARSPVAWVGTAELWMQARFACRETRGLDVLVDRLVAVGRELPPPLRASLSLRVGGLLAALGASAQAREVYQSALADLPSHVTSLTAQVVAELGVIEADAAMAPGQPLQRERLEALLARVSADDHPVEHALVLAARGRWRGDAQDLAAAAELFIANGSPVEALTALDSASVLAQGQRAIDHARSILARAFDLLQLLLQQAPSDASRVGMLSRWSQLGRRHLRQVAEDDPAAALDILRVLRRGSLCAGPATEKADRTTASDAEAMPGGSTAQAWDRTTRGTGVARSGEARDSRTIEQLTPLLAAGARRCVDVQWLGDELLFIVAGPGNAVRSVRTPWCEADTELVAEVRHRLGAPRGGATEARVLSLALARLNELLVMPWLPHVAGASQLLLSAGASLTLLPWAALVDRAGVTLLDRFSLAFAPCPSDWPALFSAPPPPLQSALLLRGDDVRAGLPPLAHADAELLACAALLRSRGVAVVGDGDGLASLDGHEVLRQHLSSSGLVHYAGHARFDIEHGMGSAIYPRSGPLSAVQLMSWGGPPSQVWVLSGCETARSDDRWGDELVGLLRPLMARGVSAVLGALWPVDDAVSSTLVVRTLARWLGGVDLASAWREEALAMRATAGFTHPALWAGHLPFGWAAAPSLSSAVNCQSPAIDRVLSEERRELAS